MVTILYFAALRDLAHSAEETLELPATVGTVSELVAYLEQIRPELAGRMGSVRVALDESFAQNGDAIGDARVIALIPPVSGG